MDTTSQAGPNDAVRGATYGLLAAALFGASAPLAKLFLTSASPLIAAGLLYLGSGTAVGFYRLLRPAENESRLRRADLPALAGIAMLGGVLGPVLMLWGLARLSALSASLMLNLEAPFTMLLAVVVFREHLTVRAILAAVLILLGAATLRVEAGAGRDQLVGMLAIAGACMAWALDNNLTQRLSLRDPFALVRTKALAAASFNLLVGSAAGGSWPDTQSILLALVVGALSYGGSVVLDAYALRYVGAAREAAYFATAPFMGALLAVLLLGESLGPGDVGAMVAMLLGVALMLRERHGHSHAHTAQVHEHVHVHDLHHQHGHGPLDPPGEPHTHRHEHLPLVHDHAHVSDLHHRHRHRH